MTPQHNPFPNTHAATIENMVKPWTISIRILFNNQSNQAELRLLFALPLYIFILLSSYSVSQSLSHCVPESVPLSPTHDLGLVWFLFSRSYREREREENWLHGFRMGETRNGKKKKFKQMKEKGREETNTWRRKGRRRRRKEG